MTTTTRSIAEAAKVPTRSQSRRWAALAPTGLAIIALVIATAWVVSTQTSYDIFIFNSCLLASLGAIALNFQMGTAGQVSMGNAAFLLLGSFAAAIAARHGVGFPLSVMIAAVAGGLVGLLVGIPALRLRGLYFALATVAFFFIFEYAAKRYQTQTVGQAGFLMDPVFAGRPSQTQTRWSWLLLSIVVVVMIAISLLTRGKFGRALRMIRDHQDAAPAFTINVLSHKLVVFGIGFALISLQGGLQAYFVGHVSAEAFTLLMTIQYIAMIIIGGVDSVVGAVAGAFIVTMLPTLVTNVLRGQLGSESATTGPQIALIVYGVLVIFFVTRAEGGVVGLARNALTRISVWRRS